MCLDETIFINNSFVVSNFNNNGLDQSILINNICDKSKFNNSGLDRRINNGCDESKFNNCVYFIQYTADSNLYNIDLHEKIFINTSLDFSKFNNNTPR